MRESPDPSRLLLTDGLAELEVAPADGGCITAFRWRRGDRVVDWLRPTPPGVGFAPNDSACFPLVPYSNRIRGGRFRFDGKDCQLKPNFAPAPHTIHGHGWRLPWRVVAQDAASLALAYDHDGSDWPAPYHAELRFALHDGALTVEIALANTGDTAMPAGLGLHPYFPRTPGCRLTAAVEKMWATDAEVMPTGLVAAVLDRLSPDASPLDNGFTGFAGRAVIDWPEYPASLTLEADPALAFLVVYTPAGKDFFCAEPVSHCTDAVNLAAAGRDDTGLKILRPGERFSATARFLPQWKALS